jgi:hypothetical protein
MLKLTPRQRDYIKSHIKQYLTGDSCQYWHGNLMNALWEKEIIDRDYYFSADFIKLLEANDIKLHKSKEITYLLLDPVFVDFCRYQKIWREAERERSKIGFTYYSDKKFRDKYQKMYEKYNEAKSRSECIRSAIYNRSREEAASGEIYIPTRLYD